MKMNSRRWAILLLILLILGVGGYRFIYSPHFISVSENNLEGVNKDSGTDKNASEIAPEKEFDGDTLIEESDTLTEDMVQDTKIGVINLELLRTYHPQMETYRNLEEQIQGYLNELKRQKDEYQLAQEQLKNQNYDLTNRLNSQLINIRDRYQKEIDDRTKELQEELRIYEENVWKEAMNRLQRKKDDLDALLEDMVLKHREKQSEQLQKYSNELESYYLTDILNLRLKLGLVQLTEEEQKKYQEQLENLELEKQKKFEEQRFKLEEDFNKFIEEKQRQLDTDLKQYQEKLMKEVEQKLQAKQMELENRLKEFIAQKEEEMHKEILERQTKLEEQAKNSLLRTHQEIQEEINQKEELLRSQIEKARAEQVRILEQVDEDIRRAVLDIAKNMEIDVVLTDIEANLDAVDLTTKVMEMIK